MTQRGRERTEDEMTFTANLVCCTSTLLREIADKRLKRDDIAKTYWLAMRSGESTDWAAVNAAIMARWSRAGLIYIKETAHKWGRSR